MDDLELMHHWSVPISRTYAEYQVLTESSKRAPLIVPPNAATRVAQTSIGTLLPFPTR